jgi:membrane-bound metal-dependent hydrolase YbcI (DUF457 family)
VDNVCHTLVGAALGEAGLKRGSRFSAAALMISANIPDLDVLVYATDTPPVSFRRGWTHGILAQIALPILMTGVFWLLNRRRPQQQDGAPPFHAGWLLLLSYAGVYSHVFLDYLNNYGVRLLTPFDWRWFYGDAVVHRRSVAVARARSRRLVRASTACAGAVRVFARSRVDLYRGVADVLPCGAGHCRSAVDERTWCAAARADGCAEADSADEP